MLLQEEYMKQIWLTYDQATNVCQYLHDHVLELTVIGCDENLRTEGIAVEGDA